MKFRITLRGGMSFEKKQEKAAAVFVKPSLRRDKSGHVVPPLPSKTVEVAKRYHQQLATTRSNWDGGKWESRHDGVGTAFGFIEGGTVWGGSHHAAQDRTIQQPMRNWDGHPIPGTAGPPLQQPYQARPFPDRIREQLQDPGSYEPRPFLDLRALMGGGDRGIVAGPSAGPEPGPTYRPAVSWPGSEYNPPGRIENPNPPPGYRS